MLYQLVQVVYWLALSSWFGGALFIAAAAQVVFRTLMEQNPILPHVLSVNLEGKHGILLGGTIVGNLVAVLWRWGFLCAVLLVITIGSQWFLLELDDPRVKMSLFVRSGLLLGAIGVMIFDSRVVWPRALEFRRKYIDNADEPDVANPANDEYEKYQRESFLLLNLLVCFLLGIVLFSGMMPTVAATKFNIAQ